MILGAFKCIQIDQDMMPRGARITVEGAQTIQRALTCMTMLPRQEPHSSARMTLSTLIFMAVTE